MNVLMMVTWYSPADAETIQAGIFHYEQSVSLSEYCDVAIYYPFDEQQESEFSDREEWGLLTFRSKMDPKKRLKNKWNVFRAFQKIRKKFRPDILHAHVATAAGVYAVLLGKMYGIPVVLTEHSPAGLVGYESRYVRAIARYVYSHTKYNACVSPHSKMELEQLFPKCKFGIVYNGVIAPKISDSNVIYRKPGYVNTAIVATFYSEWVKGYQFLLPAIKSLKDSGVKILLHIVGGGIYMEKYQQMAKELGIWDNCIFYGNCERQKVYDIVSQMDFCLSTSLIECSGVSVQEEMMLGKPLVVTKSGGANSLVTPETAIVVDKESTQAIVDGIQEMIDRKSEFQSDVIQKYAYENFEIREISKKYMEIYENIARTIRKL